MEEREADADLGIGIELLGGPQDEELIRASTVGDYDTVRRILLAAPYRLEPTVTDLIVNDLKTGRTEP